ncbi:uncharacterized protein LOC102808134 [Saccoglossus kowalevskii]
MPDVELKPSEIYYLHDSIDCRFQDGTHILDTFRELLYKTINPSLIRKIAVHNTNGKWRAYAGNRRLYIFRRLERLGVVDYITAWQVWRVDPDAWRKRETTQNGGTSVQIRNDPQFNAKINRIINEWRTSTRQVAPRAPIQNLDRNIEMDNVPTNVHTMAGTVKQTKTNKHISEFSRYGSRMQRNRHGVVVTSRYHVVSLINRGTDEKEGAEVIRERRLYERSVSRRGYKAIAWKPSLHFTVSSLYLMSPRINILIVSPLPSTVQNLSLLYESHGETKRAGSRVSHFSVMMHNIRPVVNQSVGLHGRT